MRKIILSLHISLDGFVAGLNGEMDWIKLDDEMFQFVGGLTDAADTALYGRVTYQLMDSYWPTASEKVDASKHDVQHSNWYNQVTKIVISKSLKGIKKHNTVIIHENVAEEITKLKNQKGKNILIFGSPSVARELMKHNLIDEYWLFVNPIVLGNGISLYNHTIPSFDLKLKECKIFPCGVVALNYTIE